MSADCRYCRANPDVALAFVLGDLDAETASGFGRHLGECPACAEAVEQARGLLSVLTAEEPPPCRDLSGDVMQTIAQRKQRRHRWRRTAAMLVPLAAAIALVMGGPAIWNRSHKPALPPEGSHLAITDARVARALNWIAEQQQADGSWRPADWGGRDGYRVALTGIALMAMQLKPDAYADESRRAAAWLVAQQNPGGSFGPSGEPRMYNHGIATTALLEYSQDETLSRFDDNLRSAVGYVRRAQKPDGGWGYGADDAANTSITVWQLRALDYAASRGWHDEAGHVQRGVRWLSQRTRSGGQFAYDAANSISPNDTLTAMGAYCLLTAGGDFGGLTEQRDMASQRLATALRGLSPDADYYRLYFMAEAVRAGGAEASALNRLQTQLHSRREKDGPLAGTWKTDDAWSDVGGRIYTTAMAALVLGMS